MDDLDPLPHAGHAAIVRSPFAHARIARIDVSAALAPARACSASSPAPRSPRSRAPLPRRSATQSTTAPPRTRPSRYVGEPVAVVVARDRYLAEDAAERVLVDYDPLPPVDGPAAALADDAPVLHPALGGNVASDRSFRYGDPEGALERARARRARVASGSRARSATPVECYGVVARWDAAAGSRDRLGELPGPVHAARRRGGRARHPGGRGCASARRPTAAARYGIKSAVYATSCCWPSSRALLGMPVRWSEDRARAPARLLDRDRAR